SMDPKHSGLHSLVGRRPHESTLRCTFRSAFSVSPRAMVSARGGAGREIEDLGGPPVVGDRPHLDTPNPRAGNLRRHANRLVAIRGLDYVVAAKLLLRFGERTV